MMQQGRCEATSANLGMRLVRLLLMDWIIGVTLALHMLGMAAIVGGFVAHRLGTAQAVIPLVWGARAQLVTGMVLVALNEAGAHRVSPAFWGVKLLVALAVVACAEMANVRTKRGVPSDMLINVAIALTVLNVFIAVLWPEAVA